jgi:hypothetical protein
MVTQFFTDIPPFQQERDYPANQIRILDMQLVRYAYAGPNGDVARVNTGPAG